MSTLPVPFLVGLHGPSGVGKDYVARVGFQGQGFWTIAFADGIKRQGIADGVGTYEEFYVTKPPHIRDYMQGQDHPTRWLRTFEADVALAVARGQTKIVVPDLRQPRELACLRQYAGSKAFLVAGPERPVEHPLTEEQRLHVSEQALPQDQLDGTIINDAPVAALEWQVSRLLYSRTTPFILGV